MFRTRRGRWICRIVLENNQTCGLALGVRQFNCLFISIWLIKSLLALLEGAGTSKFIATLRLKTIV